MSANERGGSTAAQGERVNMQALPATGFLRLPQVLRLIPVSRRTWWAGIKAGKYPKGVKLSENTTAWRCEDIAQLIQSLSTAQ